MIVTPDVLFDTVSEPMHVPWFWLSRSMFEATVLICYRIESRGNPPIAYSRTFLPLLASGSNDGMIRASSTFRTLASSS